MRISMTIFIFPLKTFPFEIKFSHPSFKKTFCSKGKKVKMMCRENIHMYLISSLQLNIVYTYMYVA